MNLQLNTPLLALQPGQVVTLDDAQIRQQNHSIPLKIAQ